MTVIKQPAILIIGCGYLGMSLLHKLLDDNSQLWATTRSETRLNQINRAGASAVWFDINKAESWANLDPVTGLAPEIYFLLPPGKIELACLNEFLIYMQVRRLTRLVITSSTVVYGTQSRTVDADSDVNIDNPRAQRQYEIEQSFCNYAQDSRIVRLAGLYGPGRVIGRQTVIDGEVIRGRPDGYLNLIHVDDAAELLVKVMNSRTAAPVELGCDGRPVTRGQYYRELAESLACKPPEFMPTHGSGKGRECDNRITMERTGWRPLHTDYRQQWQ